jgi:hypothetical protein
MHTHTDWRKDPANGGCYLGLVLERHGLPANAQNSLVGWLRHSFCCSYLEDRGVVWTAGAVAGEEWGPKGGGAEGVHGEGRFMDCVKG